MGLTKQYLRYAPAGNFNIITSPQCNAAFVSLEGQEGRFVAVGACEHIIIWDLRLGEKAQVLSGEKSTVTYLCASPNKRHLAVGYSDGNVQIFDLVNAEVVNIFSGHTSAITTLCYDSLGQRLASGSKDTEIIVWDIVAEVGLYRLSGHKGAITQIALMFNRPVLISSAKDTFIKFWDLDTQHCFKTLIGHRAEVWGLQLMKNDQYLITGSGDQELRVWKLTDKELQKVSIDNISSKLELTNFEDTDDPNYPLQCHNAGSLLRAGKGRVISMINDATGQIFGCHGSDQQIELFYFCSDDEAQIRFKKRLKKERKKERNNDDDKMEIPEGEKANEESETNLELSLRDEVRRLPSIKLSNKPKSLDLVLGSGGELRVTVNLANNTLELYSLAISDKENKEVRCLRAITSQGHHSELRAICFSSDNLALASGSANAVKLWNRTSQTSLRTVETGYVLSLSFVPGDRHLLVGLKDGRLLIVDIAAGDVLEDIPAHSSELWSICLQPNLRGCVTGGGDKTVKFWQFELVVEENSKIQAKVLSLLHTRTLKVEDTVLCVKLSPNSKFVAVALLDSTVKIFFVDSFKFYLSLYGHKLPVLCIDISSDSTLIVTGSADRNIKIWGMDFGDCHKSIFAHEDSITGLQFVPKTHYFFSCGKDGKVKQWDGDTFKKIISLQGHSGEARGLTVSPNGLHVCSCGSDHVLRLYERTEEMLVLQDEEEEEREQQEQTQLATGEQTVIPGQPGLNLASKKTVGAEKGAESILECLEICETYRQELEECKSSGKDVNPVIPPLMKAFNVNTCDDFLLETLKKIRASDLEESLLLLPFTSVCEIFNFLPNLMKRGDQIELVTKIMMFLLKLHHAPIVANHSLLTILKELEKMAMDRVKTFKNLVGYNLHGIQFIQRELEVSEGVQLFYDATKEKKQRDKKRKQSEKLKRSVLAMST